MRKKTKRLALVLAGMLLAASLSACGGAPAQGPAPFEESAGREESFSRETRSETGEPEKESRAEDAQGETPEETGSESLKQNKATVLAFGASYRDPVREKALQEVQEAQKNSSSSSQPSSESRKAPASSKSSSENSKTPASSASSAPRAGEKLRVGPGLEDIARLIGLQAGVETSRFACVVDVDEGENPYDVTWDYGELYDAFVKAVDWDLLFDGDYYIQTFPGLARLYHKDKALLLRHFQTVGIHEGRQGCKSFNVAAYQRNCDAKVRKAFGDNYECYYFYYALNQKTQKTVPAAGNEKKQLTVKLTQMQKTELDEVNKYRAEAGASPLEYDPELSALACYRAYVDALEDWDAHDWARAPENQDELNGMMDLLGASFWSENTVHGYPKSKSYTFKQGPATAWYINYRYSESHYKAMVAEEHHYLGSANCYISDYKKENPEHPNAEAVYVQFDVFVPSLSTPVHR